MAGVSMQALSIDTPDTVPMWRFEITLPQVNDMNGNPLIVPPMSRVQKVTIGTHTITDESEPIAQWAKHFPTTSTVDSVSMTILESGGLNSAWSTLSYFQGWMDLVHSDDGNFGLPVDYWQTLQVYSLDVGGNIIACFRIIEAWPTHAGNIDFDGASSQEAWIQVQFACTRARMIITNTYI
jgi:hypothetical protein